jgi:putative ABC transport system permease protein
MLWKDFRFACFSLLRRPAFTATVIVTLALGIGANTAIFTVVNTVLLRSLPYAEAERLATIWKDGALPRGGFELLQERTEVFEQVAGYSHDAQFSLTGRQEPVRLEGVYVSTGLFSTLGLEALQGRTFEPDEDRPGNDRVAILSHRLFTQRFAADPEVIGRTIRLDGVDRRVVGVMPPDFRFPEPGTEIWLPAVMDPGDINLYWSGPGFLRTIGRLREGRSLEQAQAELGGLMPQIRDAFPWPMPAEFGMEAEVTSLQTQVVGDVRPTILLLFAATGFVLLIGCVNIANLLLARARARRKEIALRAALGAGRVQLLRQLLTESLLLALLGGTAGWFLGYGALLFARGRLLTSLPRLEEIGLDLRVLVFSLLLTVATGLIFGLLPALRASNPDLQGAVKESSKGSGSSREHNRLSAILVTLQVALTVTLTIGAGLLVRSFWQQVASHPGFRPENLVTATVAPPEDRYDSDASLRLLYQRLLEELDARLGVGSRVGVTSKLPFGGGIFRSAFQIEEKPTPRGEEWPTADICATISTDYLQTLGVPLIRGRWLDGTDREDTPGVALISQSLAEIYWPGEEPLGKRIQLAGTEAWITIVGLVGDVKLEELTDDRRTALYLPLQQGPVGPLTIVVRSTGQSRSVVAGIRAAVGATDNDTPISAVSSVDQLIARSLSKPRLTLSLLATFTLLALLLAAVGIYGVTNHAVSQRTTEIAMRMALGAEPRRILMQVLGQGMRLALIGVAVGVPAAFLLSRVLASLLYGVSATDPLTFVASALLLTGVATLASYIPARRAVRVQPMAVLRAE